MVVGVVTVFLGTPQTADSTTARSAIEPQHHLYHGRSLVPLIKKPDAKWNHTALTAIGRGTFSIRDSRWRYIRYFDGSQELYDLKVDPDEWKNVVDDPANAKIVARLSKQIPTNDGYKRFVRYGDYKAVIPEDGSPMLLYGPGSAVIYEDKDVSGDHPEIVQAIQSYLTDHSVSDKYVSMGN